MVRDATAVTVNYVPASLNNGTFSASIRLSEGYSGITARVSNQYGGTADASVGVFLNTAKNVIGRIWDYSTYYSIESALVSLADASNEMHTALTNEYGEYTITNVAPGVFTITITKNGYAPTIASGTKIAGQRAIINEILSTRPPVISDIRVNSTTADSATITGQRT
jgi:hypothetical protein